MSTIRRKKVEKESEEKITSKYWKTWWKAALVRVGKTMAQTAVGMVTVGAAISEVNWVYIFSVSVTAGIISLLTSVAGIPEVPIEDTELPK